MAGEVGVSERPFDNFRVAITDPSYFFGRKQVLESIRHRPFEVHVLLGGRRLGKTSTLRAVEWSLLEIDNHTPRRAFPVFVSLQTEQPHDVDNLLYLLIVRLREAMDRWRQVRAATIRDMYRQYLSFVERAEVSVNFFAQMGVKVTLRNPNPAIEHKLYRDDFRKALLHTIEELRELNFEGVCFLLDETEFIVRQDWANDAWSYLRGLKDNDTALKPFLGLLLSGYRDLKDYQQKIGSPLFNIARVEWLTVLSEQEVRELITKRGGDEQTIVPTTEVADVLAWSGCHPYLTQQMLNTILDNRRATPPRGLSDILHTAIRYHDPDFASWWNEEERSDGFGKVERSVYQTIAECREGTIEGLAQRVYLSQGKVANALDVLVGTGVVRMLDDNRYVIGAGLFERWVTGQG